MNKTALSPREKIFCDLIAQGTEHGQAWTESGYKTKDKKSAQSCARRKLQEDKIKQEVDARSQVYQDARIQTWTDGQMTILEKRSKLADIARGKASFSNEQFLFEMPPSHSERIKAIELDSKLAGDFSPEKQQVQINGQINLGEALNELIGNDCYVQVDP